MFGRIHRGLDVSSQEAFSCVSGRSRDGSDRYGTAMTATSTLSAPMATGVANDAHGG